jgi:hypothetical protein
LPSVQCVPTILETVIPEDNTNTVEQDENTCGHDNLMHVESLDDLACAESLDDLACAESLDDLACAESLDDLAHAESPGDDNIACTRTSEGEDEEILEPAPKPTWQHNIYPGSKRKPKSKPRNVRVQKPDNTQHGTEQFPIYVDIDGDVSLILKILFNVF